MSPLDEEAVEHGDFGEHFDWWLALAATDPARFEAAWRGLAREVIEQAPEPYRRRLHGTQFRADMERRRSGSAMGACVRISRLMWESLVGDGGLDEALRRIRTARRRDDDAPPREGNVLRLPSADR